MYLLFDIGGTNMRIGVSEDKKAISKKHVIQTPTDFKKGMQSLRDICATFLGKREFRGVCGGIAGPLNREKTKVTGALHLKGWVNKPLKTEIEKYVQCPVWIENDAALAGLGEAIQGAGRGVRIVAYYTLGTGVGGARIVDGKIDAHRIGFEPGHQVIGIISSLKTQPRALYLEEYTSGSGLAKRYGKDPKNLNDQKIWDEVARWLAYGINNSIVHWSPDMIILGGGLVMQSRISLTLVRKILKETIRTLPEIPPIKKARLGDDAGLYGALFYLHTQMQELST